MATKRKTKTKAQKKARLAKFRQSQTENKNRVKKMQQQYYEHMMERQNVMKRANIVESIYNNKPNLATKTEDGKLVINEEVLKLNEEDNILYWVEDNNPMVSGLDALENYTKYSVDFVNQVLDVINNKASEQEDELEIEGLELIEDDSIEIQD